MIQLPVRSATALEIVDRSGEGGLGVTITGPPVSLFGKQLCGTSVNDKERVSGRAAKVDPLRSSESGFSTVPVALPHHEVALCVDACKITLAETSVVRPGVDPLVRTSGSACSSNVPSAATIASVSTTGGS